MKTLNIELVLPDFSEDLNIKINIRKGGGVEINTLPPDPIEKEKPKNTTTPKKTKKVSGNLMDLDI